MIQTIEQTDKQKMDMYMKYPKKELIKMLIECNKILYGRKPIIMKNAFDEMLKQMP